MPSLSYDTSLTCVQDYLTLKHHMKNINAVNINLSFDEYPTYLTIESDASGLYIHKKFRLGASPFNANELVKFLKIVLEQNPNSCETVKGSATKADQRQVAIMPKEEIYKRQPKPASICIQVSEAGYDYLHRVFESADGMCVGDILRKIQYEGGWSMQMELQDVLKAIQNGFLLPEHILNWRP